MWRNLHEIASSPIVENRDLICGVRRMKMEIYITIFLFALMLFALAVTVVRGHSINADQRKKIGIHAITREHQIEVTLILPGRDNV